jgi:3-methylfumaryl-CoA hydratase
MLVVVLRQEFSVGDQVRVTEEQDIVYLASAHRSGKASSVSGEGGSGAATERIAETVWRMAFMADPVLLFRFSALTSNAHRVHYDHSYATEVEGLPGLLVQGPLLALLLLELVRRNTRRPVTAFEWRVRRPVFDGELVELVGYPESDGARLKITGPGSGDLVTATVTLGEAASRP